MVRERHVTQDVQEPEPREVMAQRRATRRASGGSPACAQELCDDALGAHGARGLDQDDVPGAHALRRGTRRTAGVAAEDDLDAPGRHRAVGPMASAMPPQEIQELHARLDHGVGERLVLALRDRAQLLHLAQHGHPTPGAHLGQRSQRGAHAAGVGVVGVVDHVEASRVAHLHASRDRGEGRHRSRDPFIVQGPCGSFGCGQRRDEVHARSLTRDGDGERRALPRALHDHARTIGAEPPHGPRCARRPRPSARKT